MEKNDIKELLASFAIEFTSDTRPNSYRIQEKSSLLADPKAISTRANSIWKMSQYIIAYNDNSSKNNETPIDNYIVGWSTLVKNFIDQEQFLFLEVSKGKWYIYDSHSEKIGETEDIEGFVAKRKKIFEEAKDSENQKDDHTHSSHDMPLQKIVYGAPGTGKSFATHDKIKEIYPSKDDQKDNVFRTTFHPDSDYSTFVGAYKPTKVKAKQSQVILDYDSLVDKYKEYIEVKKNMTTASTLMGYDYHDSIVKMQPQHTIAELVADAYKNNTTYDSVLRGGMAVYESNPSAKSDKITYYFVPQTFTKAYVQAWKNYINGDKKPVFLVIEEINRGNCAQIFGDLFQLLDRDDETGMSCYPIKPDTDLGNFIADELSGLAGEATEWQSVIQGEELLLPNNLHIWATMNTSDQSLFPIDSAFKRRWKWEYVKIADKKKDWKIKFAYNVGDEEKSQDRDWWKFIEQINKIIASMTSSADKQLGYFFCKPDKKEDGAEKNTIISEEVFVGKVVFYLWNDVFKNYAMDEGNLFKFKPKPDAKEEDLTFPDFYDEEGKVNGYVAAQFIDHVMTWEKDKED